jgi:hypothetical protein
MTSGTCAGDLGEDDIGSLGSNEGLGVGAMLGEIVVYGRLRFGNAFEDAAPDAFDARSAGLTSMQMPVPHGRILIRDPFGIVRWCRNTLEDETADKNVDMGREPSEGEASRRSPG